MFLVPRKEINLEEREELFAQAGRRFMEVSGRGFRRGRVFRGYVCGSGHFSRYLA